MKTKSIVIMALLLGIMFTASGQTLTQNWPKTIKTTNGQILIYQPQLDSLVGVTLYGRSAVSYTKADGQPVFGAVWFMSPIAVDRISRNVDMTSVKILNVRFPNQDQTSAEKNEKFKNIIETEIPKWDLNLTVDEVNASLKESQNIQGQAADLNTVPPEIIYTKIPSVLLLFDGKPVFKPVQGYQIQKAVNTPFFVVQDPGDKYYYLLGTKFWYRSMDPVKGKWESIKEPPKNIRKMEEDISSKSGTGLGDQDLSVVKDNTQKTPAVPAMPPQIIVRTSQAELIQSNGEPNFAPIEGTQLLYMTNTEDNIFMNIDNQLYYVLISGRWYNTSSLNGSWNFVPANQLPADFANIPEGSDKDQVLASVAGTDAAKEAIMDAQVPQTAAVYRNTATCTVTWDGDPKFVQIRGTRLYRGANTGSTVIMVDNSTYYVCDNAVWFVGSTPDGPWTVATYIPPDIQNIPPDDPAYNVKYVYIYETTPEIVYEGYLPGYTGCYVFGPTVVYGTGFYYNPWYDVYYYPMPWTYGFHMYYNPWTGWGFGWEDYVWFMHYNWWRERYYGGWWGPPMYHPPVCPPYNHYYGPRPPMMRNNAVNINNNYYNRPNVFNNHASGVQPGTWRNARSTGMPGQNPPSEKAKPSAGNAAKRAGTAVNTKNNVYTDKNGEVYRKVQNNTWQKNDGKNWNTVDRQPSGKPVQKEPAMQPNRQPSPTPVQKEPAVKPSPQPSGQQPGKGGTTFDRPSMDRQSQIRDRSQQLNNNARSFERNFKPESGANRPPVKTGGNVPVQKGVRKK